MPTPSASPSPVPTSHAPLSYQQAGVDYGLIDPLKIQAQRSAAATAVQLHRHGFGEIAASRGESAYVFDAGPFHIATIVECLGTKALVADEMARLTGEHGHYAAIAQDTLAMAINDLVTVGATPLVVQAYWAAGGSEWFAERARAEALVRGWQAACERCGVTWGGGETPALAGIVESGRIDLAAGCTGIVHPKENLSLGDAMVAGDRIVLLASSGIHANGLSLARKVAERLPQGYLTPIDDGRSFGAALLDATALYAPVIAGLHAQRRVPHYAANITGHGWRKLLRHPGDFGYRIDIVPPVPPVLAFLAREAGLDAQEAYGTLNMGAGFALFMHPRDAAAAVEAARACGIEAWDAGEVLPGPKRLEVPSLDLQWSADELQLR